MYINSKQSKLNRFLLIQLEYKALLQMFNHEVTNTTLRQTMAHSSGTYFLAILMVCARLLMIVYYCRKSLLGVWEAVLT